VPTALLQGTVDRICPPDGARELQRRVAHCTLRLVDGVGHDPTHPAMVAAMVNALDAYADRASFEWQDIA
jgi:proline iminopeptidase